MERKNNRANKFNKILITFLQLIIISTILLLGQEFITDSEVIVITTEAAKRQSPIILSEKPEKVYDDMTIDELANQLNKSLSGILEGRGITFATYSIEYGIDPYLSVAIVLHETGCKWNCSYLASTCNNIGGQKGTPSCNGGSYRSFITIDEGIQGFYDNLYYNYYSIGLTDVYSIHKKYAEDPNWPTYIINYINEIKSK